MADRKDSNSSNEDDDEPKICTVFSSTSSNSKSVFDTIAFSMPRKEVSTSPDPDPVPTSLLFSTPTTTSLMHSLNPSGGNETTTTLDPSSATMTKTSSMISINADDLQSGDHSSGPTSVTIGTTNETVPESSSTSIISQQLFLSEESPPMVITTGQEDEQVPSSEAFTEEHQEESESTVISNFDGASSVTPAEAAEDISKKLDKMELEDDDDQPMPVSKSLFADSPEVEFPVNIGLPFQPPVPAQQPVETVPIPAVPQFDVNSIFSPIASAPPPEPEPEVDISIPVQAVQEYASFPVVMNPQLTPAQIPITQDNFQNYTPSNPSYDAWIPSEETRGALLLVQNGTYTPDTTRFVTPGIKHEEDFADKVALNIGRIFGDAEANKRRILTADNVNQDDNGLRELIKLGCYRSALNLTKRLITMYGQGPGKVGQFSKHSPHSLQLWFTRITLLVRIREFAIAGAEVEAFKEFDSVDMFYEFYGNTYGEERRGSMAPFYFRLLAAEIPQYNRKFNETIDKLTAILFTVQQILGNLDGGKTEDGTGTVPDLNQLDTAIKIWKKREIRVLYSLANASLFAKDYCNAFNTLLKLCIKDPEHEPQLKSAIARLFLQHGDLVSAQKYFQESAERRSVESESDQVDTLIDSALVAISQSSYPEALSLFQQALILQPENFTILNNMAVCLLYMGKIKESLTLMENTVRQNTPQSLQENVLLNLSSLYELENSDGYKKHALLKLIGEYKGDGVNLASLKLPNLV